MLFGNGKYKSIVTELGVRENKRNQLRENPNTEIEKDTEKKAFFRKEKSRKIRVRKKMNHNGKTKKNSAYLGKHMEKAPKILLVTRVLYFEISTR